MDDDLESLRRKRAEELQKKRDQKLQGGVITITENQFQDALRTNPRLVVDFWAEWCGPCRMVGPAIESLAQEFAGEVAFGKCNTDENQRIATNLNISAIPTIMLFSNGQLVDRVIGAYPKDVLRSRIARAFNLGT
jgi:thioredoxin 1